MLEVFEKRGVIRGAGRFRCAGHGRRGAYPLSPWNYTGPGPSDYFAITCASPELRARPPRIGEMVSFIPTYYALLAAMTSPYVNQGVPGDVVPKRRCMKNFPHPYRK